MTNVLALRIFLASPGDCEDEREVVRECVAAYNSTSSSQTNIEFELVEYDRVRGTARRAQEAIDELINECHFMLVLFKSSWGSDPRSPWRYSSGTEEELFTALLDLGMAEMPMRDVWLAFVKTSHRDHNVEALQTQLIQNPVVYFESVVDLADLRRKFTERLLGWGSSGTKKLPRPIDLRPVSGFDVLRAANLRIQGEKLIQLGLQSEGTAKLKEASDMGGPAEKLALATQLARTGEFDEALGAVEKAIEIVVGPDSSVYSRLSAEVFATQAGIYRRQGRPLDAVGRLEHALTLLDEEDPASRSMCSRILDEIGLARMSLNEPHLAGQAFRRALDLRERSADPTEVAQSHVNLARLEVAEGNLAAAFLSAGSALALLAKSAPTAIHANANLLMAQIRLRTGEFETADGFAERALSVDAQLANKRGQAMALLLRAQISRAAGEAGKSREYAEQCRALNESMGNEVGVERATWLLQRLEEETSATSR